MGRHSAPARPHALSTRLNAIVAGHRRSEAATADPVEPVLVEADDLEHALEHAHDDAPVRRPGTIVRALVYTVVLAVLAGGTLAFASLDKTVSLVVDGHARTVSTYAATVADVTREAGVPVGSRDSVVPAPSATTRNGSTVTVVHARPLTVDVDGAAQKVWVAALTVDEAMDQLGYGADGAWVTASRSSRLHPGQRLQVSLPKTITVTVDGVTKQVRSARPTVGAALAATVHLGALDRTSVDRSTAVTPGLAVTVNRVVDKTVVEPRVLPFATTTTPDPDTYVGIDVPQVAGVDGAGAVTVQQIWVDGAQESATDVATAVTTPPVDAVVKVGAKAFPADVDALNWNALSMCESSNNPKVVNSTGHYGLYQFALATWQSVGGTGLPTDATPAEQLARAKMLYIRSGQGQWECGSHLHD